jgi:hypothetical protein
MFPSSRWAAEMFSGHKIKPHPPHIQIFPEKICKVFILQTLFQPAPKQAPRISPKNPPKTAYKPHHSHFSIPACSSSPLPKQALKKPYFHPSIIRRAFLSLDHLSGSLSWYSSGVSDEA